MGYDFTIMTADIDEKAIRRDNPQDLVVALAQAKADEIISKLGGQSQFAHDPQPTLLITADTLFYLELGGVVGSVIVRNLKTGVRTGGCDKAEVYFHEIPEKVIDDLVAGGLTLEHPLISPFIDTVVGGVDTVMGLPKELTEKIH